MDPISVVEKKKRRAAKKEVWEIFVGKSARKARFCRKKVKQYYIQLQKNYVGAVRCDFVTYAHFLLLFFLLLSLPPPGVRTQD